MGRDHTIYSLEHGYVKYYKDPEKHPKRQYIGVVFERHQTLPLPRNSPRRRRLGMLAMKMETPPVEVPMLAAGEQLADPNAAKRETPEEAAARELKAVTMKPGYMYRESNWSIGRAAERARVTVRKFKPGDRWTAWKKKTARVARVAEKKRLGKKKTKTKSR